MQRSEKLCQKDAKHYSKKSQAVRLLLQNFMHKLNQEHANTGPYAVNRAANMTVVDFWETRYLPCCEDVLPLTGLPRKKPSTVRGYKQIWHQHLNPHFGKLTLQEYEPYIGTQFLRGLTATQNKTTIRHVKALGSSLFKHAVNENRIKVNPWHDVLMPDDAIDSNPTEHYTWEEAENMITALIDHVDCQLIVALACFLGIRTWRDCRAERVGTSNWGWDRR